MSYLTMYNSFRAAGMTHAGACGMLANIRAESDGISNIVQRGMQNLSDDAYTAEFDMFPTAKIRDGTGYGLCQWTFWSRKQALYDFAKLNGVSVGNEKMQVQFIIKELKTAEFLSIWKYLCSCTDALKASDMVCTQYEKPAINNLKTRQTYAATFDHDFKGVDNSVENVETADRAKIEKIKNLAAALVKEINSL